MIDHDTPRVRDAIECIRAGDLNRAYDLLAGILHEDLDNAAAWAVLAHVAYRPEAPAETIYCLNQALRLRPGDQQALAFLERLGASPDHPGEPPAFLPQEPPPLPDVGPPVFHSWADDPARKLETPPEPAARSKRRVRRSAMPRKKVRARAPALESRVAERFAVELPAAEPTAPPPPPASQRDLRRLLLANAGIAAVVIVVFVLVGPPLIRAWSSGRVVVQAAPEETAAAAAATSTLSPSLPPPVSPTEPRTGDLPSTAVAAVDTPAPTPTPVQAIRTATAIGSAPADYGPLIAELQNHVNRTARKWGYDLGIGFADMQTGQVISVEGETRYHAMSTFKGPLAAYYLWLLEHGVQELPGDDEAIRRMLRDSSNADTTCIFERVGGVASFNDWLDSQGLSRPNNFVFKWQDWPCASSGYVPEPDWRYSRGDVSLGLPGRSSLLECPFAALPCDKAFAPVELAWLYARLYQGEVLTDPAHVWRFLEWMEPASGESIFLEALPPQMEARVYTKSGSKKRDPEYRVNFVGEAGIVETPYGAFALAVFMQRNPDFPGTDVTAEVVRIAYRHFVEIHGVETP